jgi:hypothetical protein
MYGDVGKVGKRIPLTTLWLGVVKGIHVADTVRRGGICRCAPYRWRIILQVVFFLLVGWGRFIPHLQAPRLVHRGDRPGQPRLG